MWLSISVQGTFCRWQPLKLSDIAKCWIKVYTYNKVLLPTLPRQSPTRVLLPGVIWANRMRPSSVQEKREALFFDQRIGEVWDRTLEHVLSPTGRGRGCFTGIWAGEGRSSRWIRCSCAARAGKCRGRRLCARPAAAILNRSGLL